MALEVFLYGSSTGGTANSTAADSAAIAWPNQVTMPSASVFAYGTFDSATVTIHARPLNSTVWVATSATFTVDDVKPLIIKANQIKAAITSGTTDKLTAVACLVRGSCS